MTNGIRTPSGVFVADNFRDTLIIDRYDPQLIGLDGKKRNHMRSENSDDVVTWNVFRSLRRIARARGTMVAPVQGADSGNGAGEAFYELESVCERAAILPHCGLGPREVGRPAARQIVPALHAPAAR
jgi:hypothetical protein